MCLDKNVFVFLFWNRYFQCNVFDLSTTFSGVINEWMQKGESDCHQNKRVQFKDQDFLARFSCIIEITSCEKFHRKKNFLIWYETAGSNRKLDVVHKQVGGFMILKLSTKWRLYGQWRGYVVTSCRCNVVRYVGIELLGQLKRKTVNHFIFWSHIHCLCSSNTNECFL